MHPLMATPGGKRALIFGISGQDGPLLARLLIERGYEVHGTSRDAELQSFRRLAALGISDRVTKHSVSLRDFRELLQIVSAVRVLKGSLDRDL